LVRERELPEGKTERGTIHGTRRSAAISPLVAAPNFLLHSGQRPSGELRIPTKTSGRAEGSARSRRSPVMRHRQASSPPQTGSELSHPLGFLSLFLRCLVGAAKKRGARTDEDEVERIRAPIYTV
jgi:hypothetical protein